MLDTAIRLAESGFSVIWIKERSKAPIQNDWAALPVMTPRLLERSYREGFNAGVRLGQPSKIGGFYLQVFDMDIRDDDYAEIAREKLKDLLDTDDLVQFPTVISGSGGESRHFYALSERPFRSKKLWHSDEFFFDRQGKKHWCAEIELFGTGKQVVLPPSIHPVTGEKYRWVRNFNPDHDQIPVLDLGLLEELTGGKQKDADYEQEVDPVGVSYKEAEDYLAGLNLDYWCDDRGGWINVGMALHHEFDGSDEAMRVWAEFSKQSRKFDARELKRQWRSFDSEREDGITFRTVIEASNRERWQYEHDNLHKDFVDEGEEQESPPKKRDLLSSRRDDEKDEARPAEQRPIPPHILTIPGKLGLAVRHYNQTSIKTQPQFAVQAALALGSVVLGRNWMTSHNNFSSLYLVNLGVTGSGKEFGRKFVEKVLEESGVGWLVGPRAYASEAGLLSQLAYQPRHIVVYDEFGRVLDATRNSSNNHLREVQTQLMSLFGILDGTARPTAYSTNGKSKEQIAAQREQATKRPAVTLLGLSTPETFFDALSQDDVASGFMNRLIVVNSREPRRVEMPRPWKSIPAELKSWVSYYATTDEDFMGGENPTEVSDPKVVEFTPAAWKLIHEIDGKIQREQEKLEGVRLDGLLSRVKEIVMRVAFIVALSQDDDRIYEDAVQWAWDYVWFYSMEMVDNARLLMGASPESRMAEQIAEVIEEAGAKGLRWSEIGKLVPGVKGMHYRNQKEISGRLETYHNIYTAEVKVEGKKGRPSPVLIHGRYLKDKRNRER